MDSIPTLFPAAMATAVVLQSIGLPFIIARAYVVRRVHRLGIEDILSYLAWAASLVLAVLVCINAHQVGRHKSDVSKEQYIEGIKMLDTVYIFYALSAGLAKVLVRTHRTEKIFLQFKWLFTLPMRDTAYYVITGFLAANFLAYSTFILIYIFMCWPRKKIYHPELKGRCLGWKEINIAIGAVNTVSDIEALLVPVWCVWRMHLDRKRKISVIAVFAVGALAVVVGLLGMCRRVRILRTNDYTWHLTGLNIMCVAEIGLVIISACCPALKHALRLRKQGTELNTRRHSGATVEHSPPPSVLDYGAARLDQAHASPPKLSVVSERRLMDTPYDVQTSASPNNLFSDTRAIVSK
ncbi:hypothetical protein EK21DRAFT_64306 [Setomelanomma holmii]|uniref:Rhodopsin domain-containing protein n=1 Tax=Setomelanomma holmii TaxID=210430 RepID=A0A9P4LPK8_9PLEO|nr:hypothetical protein EK21DRAFT_64306 [Setomelanomma holmii]